MSRRTPALEGTARARLDGLLNALRAPGDNRELIRARALNFLGYKPSGYSREQWLRDHLTEEWHVIKTFQALGLACASSSSGTSAATSTAPTQPTGHRRARHRRNG